jgi:hypothetical protein
MTREVLFSLAGLGGAGFLTKGDFANGTEGLPSSGKAV